jgi:hypothetical protein
LQVYCTIFDLMADSRANDESYSPKSNSVGKSSWTSGVAKLSLL